MDPLVPISLQAREKELSQLIAVYKYDLNFDDVIKELRTFADALDAAGDDTELKRAFIMSRVWRVEMTDRVNFRIQLNGGNSRRKAEMWIEGSLE